MNENPKHNQSGAEGETQSKNNKVRSVIKICIITVAAIVVAVHNALIIFAIVGFVRCARWKPSDEYETYGDFLYSVAYFDEEGTQVSKKKGVSSGIMIQGLSEEGQEKETLVIPEYIDGINVVQLGKQGIGRKYFESDKLKKVFVPFSVVMKKNVFYYCYNLEKVILLSHEIGETSRSGADSFYLTSYHYSEEENTTNFFRYYDGCNYYFSNVSFMYNYDNAANDGYYWIDDCAYGERIEYIPEVPVREGYTFDGWFKESECVSKWNFETDTLPEAQYNEDEEEIYKETKLYAKWIKTA